jgi:dTDP-4-dehydrorhamnose reductase
MKILVTGANGQLGSELRFLSKNKNHFEWVFTDLPDLDLSDIHNLEKNISFIEPEIIINCAAYTNVDKAESEVDLANLINFKAVDKISKWSSANNCKLIHISTDYVFDGNSSVPLKENAITCPLNVYGLSKLKGEKACLKNDSKCIIIRTSWVYSSFGKNFVKTISSLMSQKNSLNIINDQVGCPTYARDLAEVIISIINYKDWIPGLYHYSNDGEVSWFDFAKSIKKCSDFSTILIPILTEEYSTPAKRPNYSLLDKTKIKTTYNINVPNYENSLEKCIKILKNEK